MTMTSGVNVLQKVSKGILRNGINELDIEAFKYIKPSSFEPASPLSQRPHCKTKTPISKNEYLRQRIHLVGKGSNFEKQVAKEYLSSLHFHPFARHEIQSGYDINRARSTYTGLKLIKASPNSKAILFDRSHHFVGELISLLISSTPKEMPNIEPPRLFPKEIFSEIPAVPNFRNNPDSFADYLALLCHSTFYVKGSSRLNGIIPKMVRNFMHPSNMNTAQLRDINVFNDVLYFFSERSDYATCRELFAQMKIERVTPNTKTFNILLRNVLKNSHIRKKKWPFDELIYYLKQMKLSNISADEVTWTTCYNLLLDDISRDVFIEKMIQNNVPISPHFVLAVLKNGDFTSTQILKFLSENSIPLNSKLFNLCITKLVEEQKYEIAWAFVEHAYQNASFKINEDCLNIFLRCFAKAGRLDLALLTFNTATIKYEIFPNVQSFEFLFKALSRNGYTSNFPIIFEFLKRRLKEHTRNNFNNSYWILKARAIVKFNIKRIPTETQISKAESILQTALWNNHGFQWNCWENGGSSIRKVLRFLGCVPKHVKASRKYHRFDTSVSIISKKASYKKRIRFIALQNAMLKRIPYAENKFSALKSELSERNILH
ncbi:LAFE_0B07008g1_1 [Lachancea fermentati]|uniref:Mitochondrial 15S rRNA processing factor CCM1 n=1 Tax=Lachancea fermentati TaxID=4955 RepID=A0A1G4M814_LACFM|nr:LAFE_0B07008g1_1 [Lachancea fermentati]